MTFPTPSPADWRVLAEKALKERPLESLVHLDPDGLAIRPLYAAATGGQPVSAPRPSDAEGRAWDVRTLVEGDDPAAVNAAVLADLEGGAASVLLRGAVLADSEPLARALDGVALELAPVGLDAGLDGPEAANALAVAAKGSPRAKLMFHMDPLSAFAEAGAAPRAIDEHLMLAANTAARHAGAYPEASFFMASGRVVHEAGGSIAQELGFAAANAVALVRAASAAGMTAEAALKGTVLGVSLDQEYFDGLAKVRALRLIWRTLSRAFGVETPAVIEARSSRRMLSARDPWPNLLRLTAAGYAGAVGGADAVVLDGLSRANGRSDAFARRQARNTQAVLMEEAHLGRVDDPAAGSWFLDARTRDLAEAGWAEFQRIEGEGGLVTALRTGDIQDRVAAARAEREAALASGASQLVGVTKFVDPDPRPAPFEAEATHPAQTGGDACDPLTPIRLAAPFETQQWEAGR
ncbi:MAG: methylmalonyl-CoA mutase family protein [Brevundimonas sp.]|uniref:methylmalonyl-CoA mutase family protein n=1 Tax=Brevundimonas sp. TaxID=1871086 RepID=UPI0027251BD2|nr:methylmalonyl-CoA mutase family protein [Brevundimonas sp.]MDO9077231.1 methylmalonyl-CoA mutase family protein [Brevundimonas sp.]MDP3081475.1 methylmalonyl-CoA mutase family protein [Brevundimonas sp.]MDZ4060043.1 methylmalonyl-CoA mutase family protein [Brevundimonas sp.]